MKLEQQVVSLELAKKLKELGVKQESLFYWSMQVGGHFSPQFRGYTSALSGRQVPYFSAFTVAELGEMLPTEYREKNRWHYSLVMSRTHTIHLNYWSVRYEHEDGSYEQRQADTEADARAKMLIYLIENDLVTP